jgi:hypothetical protein
MIVYFDTVRRKRPVREGGELIKLDWAAKKVLRVIPLFPSDPDILEDPNPRGNSRGGKGILVRGGEVFVGTYHTILVFDLDLNLKRRITNHLFANIHEMCFAGKNIWVSSTTLDCALLIDPGGRTLKTWWPREEPLLQEHFGLAAKVIDKAADNRLCHLHHELSLQQGHTHLNAICRFAGRIYALLNRLGALVQVEPEVRVVLEDGRLRGSHSPVIVEAGRRVVVCSSFNRDLLFFDLQGGALVKRIHLLDFPEVARLYQDHPDQPFNKAIFVRGLEIVGRDRLLVGISPASILEVDTAGGRLLGFFSYRRDVGDAVHGLAHVPGPSSGGGKRKTPWGGK